MDHESDKPFHRQHHKGYEMKPHQRLCQKLPVAHQTPEARHPTKAAFDDLAVRQQHAATLDRGQCDNLRLDAIHFGGSSGLVIGIADCTSRS